METALMHYSSSSSSGDYKHRIGIPTWNSANNRSLYSYPSDNIVLSSFLSGGYGYCTVGGLYHSPPIVYPQPPQNVYNLHPQPPLLPLPISTPPLRNYNSKNNIRINKNMKSLTPKKSKNQKKDSKKPEAKPVTETAIIGPDPKDLPKDVITKVFSSTINDLCDNEFSGSVVFTPSPPPSSLPLPTFSLRPKLGCHVEADAGATDNLRRLLRL